MEAPEKIYVHVKGDKVTNTWNSTWIGVNDVEYICTDAFIKKACEYMRNHIDRQLTIYHEQTWKKRDEFIKDFKNYMKGE